MYAIKARFDGAVIIPAEDIPVKGSYEAIVMFIKPAEPVKTIDKTVNDLDEFFYRCFQKQRLWNGDGVELIRNMHDEW